MKFIPVRGRKPVRKVIELVDNRLKFNPTRGRKFDMITVIVHLKR